MSLFSRKKHSVAPSTSAPASGLAPGPSQVLQSPKSHLPSWSAYAPPFGQSPLLFPRHSYSLSMSATAAGELFLFGGDIRGIRAGSASASAVAANDLYVISTRNYFSTTFLQTSGDIPSIRYGHRAVLTGCNLLIWGGIENSTERAHDDSLYLLNLESRKWSKIVINGPKPSGRYDHNMTLVGSKIFVFGGKSHDGRFNDIWALKLNSLQSNPSWKSYEPAPGNEKPHPRANHVSVTSGDRIIIFGGCGGNDTWLNDTWSFNISTRKWTELECTGSIPSPRTGHAAVLIDDLMYVFGGFGGGQTYLNDLTVFNLSTQRWTAFQDIGSSPCKRTCHAMARDGTRVFVLGGFLPQGVEADETKPINVLETKLLNFPEPDVINPSEEAAQLVGKSSPSPSMRGQLHQPSSLSNAHAAHRGFSFQKELDHRTFQHVTREQNAGLNDLPSRPTGASGGPRRVPEDSRLIELERQLSETLVAQTERDLRIGQLTDELAQATEEKKRAGQEQRELQTKLDESLLSHDHALEQAEGNMAKEKKHSALELRKLQTKLDESLLSRDQAEANIAEEKKRAELEKRELQMKLDESLLSRNHTVNQVEASAAEEKRRATLELRELQVKFDRLLLSRDQAQADAAEAKKHAGLEQRELQVKLDRLMLSRDQAEANAAEVKRRAGLEQRELQVKLDESILSRDEHLRMLEKAQIALQEATSRAADADERGHPACEHVTELAELRAELEGKKSELAAVRFRLTKAKDGWAKGKAKAYKSHTVTAATFVDLNEDQTDLTEDVEIMEAGLRSLKWSEKGVEDMDCGNEG